MGGQVTVIAGLDSRLVKVVMIRIAQNMMFVEMLKKNAQDVVFVRKTMPKFVVPRLNGNEKEDGRSLELSDFVPFTGDESFNSDEPGKKTLNVFSLALARSYATLVAQVFRCMSRNSNDREEMANFVAGLNRILLVHGDDIGIVGHVLIGKPYHFLLSESKFYNCVSFYGCQCEISSTYLRLGADMHYSCLHLSKCMPNRSSIMELGSPSSTLSIVSMLFTARHSSFRV